LWPEREGSAGDNCPDRKVRLMRGGSFLDRRSFATLSKMV